MPDRDKLAHHDQPGPTVPGALIPQRLLIAARPFGRSLTAPAVAAAIARGVSAAGRPAPDLCPIDALARGVCGAGGSEPDLCPIDALAHDAAEMRALLDGMSFDRRMRVARAVVVACARLQEHALAGSVAFEIATRARQGGVPTYAITAHNRLDAFDARMLDLQLMLEARTAKGLADAGRKLAELA